MHAWEYEYKTVQGLRDRIIVLLLSHVQMIDVELTSRYKVG